MHSKSWEMPGWMKHKLKSSVSEELSVTSDVEEAMAPHSNIFAWKIPWMEEPGRLQSMGSLRVGHD